MQSNLPRPKEKKLWLLSYPEKLPEVQRPDKVGRTNDPNYYLFHRMVHHPTSKCFILKDKIQALVDAGVLTVRTKKSSPIQ